MSNPNVPQRQRRTRSRFMTGAIGCDPGPPPAPVQETEFEKRRGAGDVEIRHGYAQVHVQGLPAPAAESRLAVLRALMEAGVSFAFMKLSASGMLFLVPDDLEERTSAAIRPLAPRFVVQKGRSMVLVHAVNMRDEEGLLARVVSIAIGSGAKIDHLGDMHDRLLIATASEEAERLASTIRERLVAEGA